MGFYKKFITYQSTITALQSKSLKTFYQNADALIFLDVESEKIHTMFIEGKTDEEILKLMEQ